MCIGYLEDITKKDGSMLYEWSKLPAIRSISDIECDNNLPLDSVPRCYIACHAGVMIEVRP